MHLAIPRHNLNFSIKELFLLLRTLWQKPRSDKKRLAFENEFSAWLGTRHAFAFSSGSAALYHAIKAGSFIRGDGIVFPGYEFISVAQTLRHCGLRLSFADADPRSGNVTAASIERAVKKDTKAVLVANIHGTPADLPAIRDLCDDLGLLMIEDCAHSLGAKIDGQKAGTFGDLSIFSFGAGKSLAAGGGGMAVTSDNEWAKRILDSQKKLSPPPWSSEAKRAISGASKFFLSTRLLFTFLLYPALLIGSAIKKDTLLDRALQASDGPQGSVPDSYLYAFSENAARLALSQLQRLDGLNAKRKENANALSRQLADTQQMAVPGEDNKGHSVALNYPVCYTNARKLALKLLRHGIDTRKDYLFRFHENMPNGYPPRDTIYLPNHPGVSKSDTKRIADAVRKIVAE
jgi:dTDP-4-amino-4,6-dideoxygalactose transaminase